ncbi:hypothetical protein E3P77_01782 [Wallemia ichthyophaga]|uniref:Putative 5'-nucleotidase C-terminal domain-containing protein n=1 Tax=Wallemia ichthyophaga (strain EXF-994 / CBS 113033) TaxID=1299270 RepID=R9AFT9_WALI9|nr:uncharacterized protein J056_004802 [Wallemia ichthyophaga EXF-994]TIA74914.1 hypothetical protein E3P91_00775 [Wallemia ichthyophaga]EOR00990.1 hypothetical protein J056_004802 [Wallemia ichthyophaga EXF-994]TIA81660.1 hypothetical protein E3P98_01955 [Wallemia ichthyophaga]TIA94162.1 hypothetical protein E3P97_00381 [Wallemia ichthyophaga]TIA99939.1 hypothetical protein E3P96_02763 [Wallemia ichthyophaga]
MGTKTDSVIFILTILTFYYIDVFMQRQDINPVPPSRSIEWGEYNFLHTTDIHGWLAGHKKKSAPEPNGSGDWGDYASFVDHMRSKANDKGVELFVIDSGDLHDGSGLSDAVKPGDVNGHDTNNIISMLDIDMLTIGNHGLYNPDVTLDIYKNFTTKWSKRYLTSNTNITDPDTNESVSIGERYLKHVTKSGRKFTAFGILFNFPNSNWRAHVQPIEEMVKEAWFDEATDEAPEFFLIIAHMAINDSSWNVVLEKLKQKHPLVPIISFGGHQHVRDCVFNYDDGRDVRMASGRFLETVGWMGVNISSDGELEVSRKYLDANPVGYAWHLDIDKSKLVTHLGKKIKEELMKLWNKLGLGQIIGKIDRDLYQSRVPATHPDSLTYWMKHEVLPSIKNPSREYEGVPRLILMNSGAIRFDLYKGMVNKNDVFTAFPFSNSLPFVKDVPFRIAKKMLVTLNNLPENPFLSSTNELKSLSIGYKTDDTCPGVGDDVAHARLEYYDQPALFSTELDSLEDEDLVDVVFISL